MKLDFNQTKRGGASMFVVMFTVIILSIITLSFTRLVLSESQKTSDTDLSQSAYDSALAGIEDAKIALLRYHACLDQGYRPFENSSNDCERIIYHMQKGIRENDCSTVSNVLRREANAETKNGVVIQETQNSTDVGNNTNMLQAYTCVTIKEDLEDYRTTLDQSSRMRIIPIRSEHIDQINNIRLKWFSKANFNKAFNSHGIGGYCEPFYPNGQCNGSYQAPPTVSVRFIQTDEYFDFSELSLSRTEDQTNTGQLYLVPSNHKGVGEIDAKAWGESANKGENQPLTVRCDSSFEWICDVKINLPKTFNNSGNRNDANTYLLVSLPYGTPETDLSVQAYAGDTRYDFTGVQARVDSTGRANDLYRRIETRVELVDTYFAYPEFEITMNPNSTNPINKSFDVTFKCWLSNNGVVADEDCDNSYEDVNYSVESDNP